MARATKYITLEGQYAAGVLGTFQISRGFATLQDLALISAPYPLGEPTQGGTTHGHQREVNTEHAEAIKRYLQDGDLRFVPEVILTIRANYRDELDDQQRTVGVISDDTPGLTVKRRWKSKNVQTHQVHIERQHLTRLVTDEKRIRRIDGNHRLHLADQLQEDATSPTEYLAPFCVILLGPPDDGNDDYVESMLFHTINNTALPLDSEHALRLILGQAEGYRSTDDDEFATSPALHLTRLLKARVDALPVPLQQRLGPTPEILSNVVDRVMIRRPVV